MINKLILGTVQLGLDYGINNSKGKPNKDQSFEILDTAYNNGIRTLDTAEAYGESQKVIGQFIKENPSKAFKIISKLSAKSSVSKNNFLDNLKNNCDILSVESLHCFMFHNYQSFNSNKKLYGSFIEAKDKKLTNKIGLSLYTNNELLDVIDNYSEFDVVQVPFNLFDNASRKEDLMEKAKGKNIEIHVRSVFLQGLFFKNYKHLTDKLKPISKYLEVIENLKREHNLTTEQLALQYVLQKNYINKVLIGVDSKEQLLKNLEIVNENLEIPHKTIDKINFEEVELLNPTNWN